MLSAILVNFGSLESEMNFPWLPAQDKLYKEKFSALPGLNSPARLIREIVRPPRSRLHAASSAAADAAEASPVTPL